MLFDAFTSLVLFDRVASFYLIPGHSHMRPDNVTGLCKMALQRQNLFLPEQVAEKMNTVRNMDAEVIETGEFYDWSILKKYMQNIPGGFTVTTCLSSTMEKLYTNGFIPTLMRTLVLIHLLTQKR